MASTAMNPTLCRLKAYSAPGLPRPTKSFISSSRQKERKAVRRRRRLVLLLLLLLLLVFLPSSLDRSGSFLSAWLCGSRGSDGRTGFLGGAADNGRDREVVLGRGWLDARGERNGRDMHAVADLEAGQIHVEMLRNGICRAAHFDLVAHDVQDAAALDAGGGRFVQEAYRDIDGDQRMLADAQEVHMNREFANGVELYVAWDHPRLGAIEIEHEDGALEVAGMQLQCDRLVVHVDGLRRRLVAIQDAGNAPLATRRACAALAGARPRPGLEFQRLSHEFSPIEPIKGLRQAPILNQAPAMRSNARLTGL